MASNLLGMGSLIPADSLPKTFDEGHRKIHPTFTGTPTVASFSGSAAWLSLLLVS